ncbi:MAG: hypothetical protein AB7S38_34175 [Vulcanimicrobiota bacterium]
MKQRAGFVLIATMMVVLVLSLLVRVALLRLPVANTASNLSSDKERARRAVLSGLDYAACQLREDPHWRGNGNTVVVDQPDLHIEEQQGNVLGRITDPDGSVSEFRIRFNFYDGSPGAIPTDGLPDPIAGWRFETRRVSINNMSGQEEAVVPEGLGGSYEVLDPTVGPQAIPAHSACIFVEGRVAGKSHTAPQVASSIFRAVPDRSVDDAVIMAGGNLDIRVAESGKVWIKSAHRRFAQGKAIRLRSKGTMKLRRPSGSAPLKIDRNNLTVELGSNGTPEFLAGNATVTTSHEEPGDSKDFYRLRWSQVRQARTVTDDPRTVCLYGGTYVYGLSDPADPASLSLAWLDMSYDDYRARITTDPTFDPFATPLGHDFHQVRPSENLAACPDGILWHKVAMKFLDPLTNEEYTTQGLSFENNQTEIRVLPSPGGHSSFALVPTLPPRFIKTAPLPTYALASDGVTPDRMKIQLERCLFSVEGDLHLQGSFIGEGTCLTSTGEVRILSGRTLSLASNGVSTARLMTAAATAINESLDVSDDGFEEAEPDETIPIPPGEGRSASVRLTIYARGDLKVSSFASYLGPDGRYRNLTFRGLLYSWGDVYVYAADGAAELVGGQASLQGAVVAYGQDPSAASGPGTSASLGGDVRVFGRNVCVHWDPRYLPNLVEMQPEGTAIYTIERSALHFHP